MSKRSQTKQSVRWQSHPAHEATARLGACNLFVARFGYAQGRRMRYTNKYDWEVRRPFGGDPPEGIASSMAAAKRAATKAARKLGCGRRR